MSYQEIAHPAPLAVDISQPTLPGEVKLFQNYPNPFNPSTVIRYALTQRSQVRLEVFNLLGERVVGLFDGVMEPGNHEVEFKANNIATRVYFYRLQVRPLDSAVGRDSKSGARNFLETRKLLLMR
jgi:hypothetical protein